MNKIPVGETILRGYGFAARRFLPNLGRSWLAAVFYALAVGYWLEKLSATILVSPHTGGELSDFALFDLFCLIVVTAFASAVIAIALTREALEPSSDIMTASLAVGRREWRMFFGLICLYGLAGVSLFAIAVAGREAIAFVLPLLDTQTTWQGISVLPVMNVAVDLFALAALAFIVVRLGALLAPVVADVHRPLTDTWTASRGNFWRFLIVGLALALPVACLCAAAEWVLLGNQFGGALAGAVSTNPDSTALYQAIGENAVTIAVGWTVLLVALNMILAGASAFAFVTLRDGAVAPARTPVSAPVFEPSFAGSFALDNPRLAKQPVSDPRIEPQGEVPPLHDMAEDGHRADADMVSQPLVSEGQKTTLETPADLAPEVPPAEQAPAEPVAAHPSSSETAVDAQAGEMPSTDGAAEKSPVDAHRADPDQPDAFTPLPSRDDATESSPQNVPSEAA